MINSRRKQGGLAHAVRLIWYPRHMRALPGKPVVAHAPLQQAPQANSLFGHAWWGGAQKANLLFAILAVSDLTPTVKWAAGLISIVLVRDCEGAPLRWHCDDVHQRTASPSRPAEATPVTEARAGARALQARRRPRRQESPPHNRRSQTSPALLQCNDPGCIVLVAFARRVQPVLVAW